eukprot:954519-Prymnesium_polylepis.2
MSGNDPQPCRGSMQSGVHVEAASKHATKPPHTCSGDRPLLPEGGTAALVTALAGSVSMRVD